MASGKTLTAIGLMSGTSLDGIDAALVRTDGTTDVQPVGGIDVPYDPVFREQLRGCLGKTADQPGVAEVARELTLRHAAAVARLIEEAGLRPGEIDVIGFHGQTTLHRPDRHLTVQIGDGALLARQTGIPVVGDFRSADVAAGGQGAPFAPLYHRALAHGLDTPLAVLNIGGVANVSYIGGAPEGRARSGRRERQRLARPRDGSRFARGRELRGMPSHSGQRAGWPLRIQR